MEIYSYSNIASTPRKLNTKKQNRNHFKIGSTYVGPVNKVPDFSGKTILAIKNLFLSVKNLNLKNRFLLWIIPCALISVLSSVAAVKIVKHSESFAKKITLPQAEDQILSQLIEGAMIDFAMEEYTGFDEEGNIISLVGINQPSVTVKAPVTFKNYTVKSGDTVGGITSKFGLKNISTLIAVNNIGNVRSLQAGKKLVIPSYDGLYHTVLKNESVKSIAAKYKIPLEDLLDVNDLDSDVISAGQKLFVPGARLDSEKLQKAMGEHFTIPIYASYRISSRFGARPNPFTGVPSRHFGLDFACPTGTPIHAAMSGTVVKSDFNNLYGNYVIIQHHDGYQTLYGHMNKSLVQKGKKVTQGDKIGLVGNTGWSTGSHLHLSVYKNNKPIDPETVLKRK